MSEHSDQDINNEPMIELIPITEVTALHWYRQPAIWLITLSVLFALLSTSLALYLYNASGIAQVDLSQPGYETVLQDIDQAENLSFQASGPITQDTIDQFTKLYDQQASKTETSLFKSNALSNKSLGIRGIAD